MAGVAALAVCCYGVRWWLKHGVCSMWVFCVAGLAWSADSYQLAGLDGSSNLKVWWMRPEERDDGEKGEERLVQEPALGCWALLLCRFVTVMPLPDSTCLFVVLCVAGWLLLRRPVCG